MILGVLLSLSLTGIILLKPLPVRAQASVNVNNLDYLYRDIDKLVAHQLVDIIIVGQRPYSRREFARITSEAMRKFPALEKKLSDPNLSEKKKRSLRKRIAYIKPILARLKKEFREELIQRGVLKGETKWYSVHLLDKVYADTTVTNSLPRTVPANGLGQIDAFINPLVQYRQGRHIVDGGTLSLETTHWVRASNHLAINFRPRVQLGIGRDGQPDINDFFVQELYAKFFVKNFEIEIGRDNVLYGQGKNAGLLLSNNPRGLDMIKLSNDTPFIFPSVLKYLGAIKLSYFLANLGPEQNFSYPFLVGYKLSAQPLSFFEFGFALLTELGGQGAPFASTEDLILEVVPFGALIKTTDIENSNKMGGFDFRFRIPTARNLELYSEIIWDDSHTPSDIQKFFWDDVGYIGGFYLGRITNSGTVDMRFEFHHTGIRYYQHGQFSTGLAMNQFILGDILGPNGLGLYGNVSWDINSENILSFDGALESRSADVYTTAPPFIFVKVEDKPEERRFRGVASWLLRMNDIPLTLGVQLGFERVQNFNFIAGNGRNNFLGRVNLQIDIDSWTRFPRGSS